MTSADTEIRGRSQPLVALGADARLRVASALRLARRQLQAALHNPSVYLMVTLGCLAAAAIVKSYLDFVARSGTLVLADPFSGPLLLAVALLTGYLGMLAAAGLAGERERGTLEVLFYGPVDAPSYIGGSMLGHLGSYGLALIVLAAFMVLAAFLVNFPLNARWVALLGLSIVPAASMVALGLLLAALVGRVRRALALTALVSLVFVAIEVGTRIAAGQPTDTLLGSAAGLLSTVAALIGWISPFSYVWRAEEALALGSVRGVIGAAGGALLYAGLLARLAVAALQWRGVQRWRE